MFRQVGRLRLAAIQDAGLACYSTLEQSRCLSDTDRIYSNLYGRCVRDGSANPTGEQFCGLC
jgi:hypothetical protein